MNCMMSSRSCEWEGLEGGGAAGGGRAPCCRVGWAAE